MPTKLCRYLNDEEGISTANMKADVKSQCEYLIANYTKDMRKVLTIVVFC